MNNSVTDSTERFSNRVENYIKYRPGYPDAVIRCLADELNLYPSHTIADIGSGTGIFSNLLLKNGNRVFGIEPNAEMRNASKNFLSVYEKFTAVNGTSEHTRLPDQSVDLITAAQAYHWFVPVETGYEFRRILKKDGAVVLLWNSVQYEASEFLVAYQDLILKYSRDYSTFSYYAMEDKEITSFFPDDQATVRKFDNWQSFDDCGFKG